MEIISTRKVGKRVSPSREFTEYIGNETGNGFAGRNRAGNDFAGRNGAGNGFAGPNRAGNSFVGQNGAGNGFTGGIGLFCEWEWEWLTALRVVIASHMGTASHIGITS